jgi:predicted DNA-binding transcriptional regulator AlpA
MDKALLIYEMDKRGISIKMMCKKLGISRSAFYRKCNGITEFTLSEIKIIIDYLELEFPNEIFFAQKVS